MTLAGAVLTIAPFSQEGRTVNTDRPQPRDPKRIRQLRDAVPGMLERPRDPGPPAAAVKPGTNVRREPPPGFRVRRALGVLMRAVGREEVDRVYGRVFGVRPDEKE
jgi:hypothetical protein